MDRVTRIAFFAKPEVQKAVSELRKQIAQAVPEGGFAEREATMLVLIGE